MNPVLYVAVREDLMSMTPGKAMAHSGHAASRHAHLYSDTDLYKEWAKQGQGFGTQINLSIPFEDWGTARHMAELYSIPSSVVIDPTYPFIVPTELLPMIDVKQLTSEPVLINDKKYMCTRRETTAFFVFLDRDDESHVEYHERYLKKYSRAK